VRMREEESEWGTRQLEKVGATSACVVGVDSTATRRSCARAVWEGRIRQARPIGHARVGDRTGI
jgi:aerobic-type carbon monoxide dehydrogenase small subunit (CoxS/CutS family)